MNRTIQKSLMLGFFALCAAPLVAQSAATAPAPAESGSATLSKSQWMAKVGDAAQKPQVMRETMKQLSPSDQTAFLAAVNEAISKMQGSDDAKAAMFYAANAAAVQSASKGNVANVLAEVFATVPPENLTQINESFAKEIFSRQNTNISDERFTELSKNTMNVINERCAKSEDAGVRQTFAVCMFTKASGGSPAGLADTLIDTMPDANNRQKAKSQWIGPALGVNQPQSYDPMLGDAQAGDVPGADLPSLTTLTGGSDITVSMLGDLDSLNGRKDFRAGNIGGGAFTAGSYYRSPADIGLNNMPRAHVQNELPVGGNAAGSYEDQGQKNPWYSGGGRESGPYREQTKTVVE